MALTIIFATSGVAMVMLMAAKSLEERRRKPFFVLNTISRNNVHIRTLHRKALSLYAEGKEKIHFKLNKQLPLRLRNFSNKLASYIREKQKQYANNMRDSRLLKRSDGISEFFKSLSDVERESGEINDVYGDGSQERQKEVD